MLRLLSEGKGIDQALLQIAVSYRAYRNAVAADPEFREAVQSARRVADQTLDEVGYLLAHHNPDILIEVWQRRDKAHAMREGKTVREQERAEDRKERLRREKIERRDRLRKEKADRAERDKERALRLHLAEMAATARAKELAAKADGSKLPDETPLPLDRLTPEQRETYREIARILTGDDDPGSP